MANMRELGDIYKAERDAGMTYQKMSEKHGVSKQSIHQAMKACGYLGFEFRPFTKKQCIYHDLRLWLNINKVPVGRLVVLMGDLALEENVGKMRDVLSGIRIPNKKVIDKLIAVAGMPYEQLFAGEGE